MQAKFLGKEHNKSRSYFDGAFSFSQTLFFLHLTMLRFILFGICDTESELIKPTVVKCSLQSEIFTFRKETFFLCPKLSQLSEKVQIINRKSHLRRQRCRPCYVRSTNAVVR